MVPFEFDIISSILSMKTLSLYSILFAAAELPNLILPQIWCRPQCRNLYHGSVVAVTWKLSLYH